MVDYPPLPPTFFEDGGSRSQLSHPAIRVLVEGNPRITAATVKNILGRLQERQEAGGFDGVLLADIISALPRRR